MGLDTIELVMEVEETFNIDIPDEAAAEMMTVGELYEFIVNISNSQITTGNLLRIPHSTNCAKVYRNSGWAKQSSLQIELIVYFHLRTAKHFGNNWRQSWTSGCRAS